jgi:hypothetical protein
MAQLTSIRSLVVWMANFQARRRQQDDQQDLQTRPDSIHRYPAFTVLRSFSGRSLARSTLQRCHCRHGFAVNGLSDLFDNRPRCKL